MLTRFMVASLLASTVLAVTAQAADMPDLFPHPYAEEADPSPQFEFGTGWYLRGDLSASYDHELAYSSDYLGTLASSTPFPSVAYAATGRDVFTTKEDWAYGLGVGFGYKLNNWFRTDFTADYLGEQRFNAGARAADNTFSTVGKSTIERWDGLINGYLDLGNWSGFQPYVGAGVGFASYTTNGTADVTFGGLTKHFAISDQDQYQLAWAAMAGFGYKIAPHMVLDVGYRYLDGGTYRIPFTGEKKSMTSQQARVGLRYMID